MEDFTENYANEESTFGSDCDTEIDDEISLFGFENIDDWTDEDLDPTIHTFSEQPRLCIQVESSPIDIFEHFFGEEMMNHIVRETNLYQNQNKICINRENMKNWEKITNDELYSFFALIFLTGMLSKRKMRDYWSLDPLLQTPVFNRHMSRNRFYDILRCLHFSNNREKSTGKLSKISPVLEMVRKKFILCTYPGQNLCIDESLMLWKGRISFKQYIPSKRNRFGIKLFILADCSTRIILDFIIYTGKDSIITHHDGLGQTGDIVMTLMKPFLNKGHILYVDNWYTSPKLFNLLFNNKTGACGTARKNRKNYPQMSRKLKIGEVETAANGTLLALKWKDKRDVFMLSSIHSNIMADTGKRTPTNDIIKKPQCIVDYNMKMGAIDHIDMQMSFTECVRKTVKWYKKLFFHLMDLAAFNSYIIYKKKTKSSISLYDFKKELVRQMLEKYKTDASVVGRPSSQPNPARMVERHFPDYAGGSSGSRRQRKRCVVCSKAGNEVKLFINVNNVMLLCVFPFVSNLTTQILLTNII